MLDRVDIFLVLSQDFKSAKLIYFVKLIYDSSKKMGGSHSKSESEQSADIQLTQIYKGTCDITCQNIESDISVDIINSVIGGGIIFSQSCSANGNCIFGNTMDATSDVFFKATNSSNAKNAWSGWSLDPFNFDTAESKSRQNIKESITESVTETCKVSSYNQMNNISVFTANSQIGGGIEFNQSGNATGKCTLDNTMSAAAYATGMAQNTATSGKDKKGQKFGDKSSIFRILTYIGIGLVVLIVTIIVAKLITGHLKKTRLAKDIPSVKGPRGRLPPVQCPPGTQLMLNPVTRMFSCARVGGAPPRVTPPRALPPRVSPPRVSPPRATGVRRAIPIVSAE